MRQLYKPKMVKGFSTCICGIFLPANTLYMRTKDGYVWCAAYDVKNRQKGFTMYSLRVNDKFPRKMYVSGIDGLGLLFTRFIVDNKINPDKPVECINRQNLGGLLPKNQMVSKAYSACAVYADAKETKTKKSIEWRM